MLLGTFTQIIPGSEFFRDDDDEGFQFDGSPPGITRIDIGDDGEFRVKARGLDLSGFDLSSPLLFSFHIGNDGGGTPIALDEDARFRAED